MIRGTTTLVATSATRPRPSRRRCSTTHISSTPPGCSTPADAWKIRARSCASARSRYRPQYRRRFRFMSTIRVVCPCGAVQRRQAGSGHAGISEQCDRGAGPRGSHATDPRPRLSVPAPSATGGTPQVTVGLELALHRRACGQARMNENATNVDL